MQLSCQRVFTRLDVISGHARKHRDIMPAFRVFSLLTEPIDSTPYLKLNLTIVESHKYNLFLNTNSFHMDNLNRMALRRLTPS